MPGLCGGWHASKTTRVEFAMRVGKVRRKSGPHSASRRQLERSRPALRPESAECASDADTNCVCGAGLCQLRLRSKTHCSKHHSYAAPGRWLAKGGLVCSEHSSVQIGSLKRPRHRNLAFKTAHITRVCAKQFVQSDTGRGGCSQIGKHP